MAPPSIQGDVAPEVAALGVPVAFGVFNGLSVPAGDDRIDVLLAESLGAVLDGLTPESIQADPTLDGYRRLHDRVGASGRKNLASSESLLLYALKHRRLPRVNVLVDLYNLVSVETRLSLGAHDLAHVSGRVTLRVTDGSERFHPLGAAEPEPIRPGEYAYVDASNDVLCRLDVRQAEKTRLTPKTNDCLFIVQGNSATPPDLLSRAASRLVRLVHDFCGGEHYMLPAPPAICPGSAQPSRATGHTPSSGG